MLGMVELQSLKAHTNDVTCCDFSLDFLLVTGSGDKTVRVWSWNVGLGYVEVDWSPLRGHKYGVTCVTFSPQGIMVASSSIDGTTVLWGTRTGNKIYKFSQVNGDGVRVCKFSSDSCTLATGGDNGVICLWDLVHKTLLRTIQHHEDTVHSLCLTPDASFMVTTCGQGHINVYYVPDLCDTTINEVPPLLSIDGGHDLGVLCCDFSSVVKADEDHLSSGYALTTSGNDQSLRQWRVRGQISHKGGVALAEITSDCITRGAHSSAITCVRYNKTGDLVCSASLDKTIKAWDGEGNCIQTLDAHSRYVNCVAFSRDGILLCSGSNDKTVRIWDITGGSLSLDSEIVLPCIKLSHFGRGDLEGISALQEEDMVNLRGESDETDVVLLQMVEVHMIAINGVQFGPGGLLATCSGDKTVRVFYAADESDLFLEVNPSPVGLHRYQVNGVEFNGTQILSCSLDGIISIWGIPPSEPPRSMGNFFRSLAGVRCFRVYKDLLIAAYDDGCTALWRLSSCRAPLVVYPEHSDAATCCDLSPDGRIVSSASHNGDLRLYELLENGTEYNQEPVHVIDCAHDLGVQGMDFASKTEDLPLQVPDGSICHLLASCGNDCLAKIWKILIPKLGDITQDLSCVEWRTLTGHGSSVTSIKFPSTRADLVCTTSTDKQARIWNTYSGHCLHVMEHESLVTCCTFSRMGSLLATGCLSGNLYIWKLPNTLMESDAAGAQLSFSRLRRPLDWSCEDVARWARECVGETEDYAGVAGPLVVRLLARQVTGRDLMTASEEDVLEMLGIDKKDEPLQTPLLLELQWLRKGAVLPSQPPPHHLLCPITHSLMLDPVRCADGFTYERRAINEWFLSGGKCVSPMTNQPLLNNQVVPNRELMKSIRQFVYGEEI